MFKTEVLFGGSCKRYQVDKRHVEAEIAEKVADIPEDDLGPAGPLAVGYHMEPVLEAEVHWPVLEIR